MKWLRPSRSRALYALGLVAAIVGFLAEQARTVVTTEHAAARSLAVDRPVGSDAKPAPRGP